MKPSTAELTEGELAALKVLRSRGEAAFYEVEREAGLSSMATATALVGLRSRNLARKWGTKWVPLGGGI